MNVWEFLQLPANHREPDKTVMKVKHIAEVPDSKKGWPMTGQIKKDGVYAIVVLTCTQCMIFSRTGNHFTNVSLFEKGFVESGSCEGVYIAELCNDYCSLEVLSGMVNPNRVNSLDPEHEQLMKSSYLAFHDYLYFPEFSTGVSKRKYTDRWEECNAALDNKFELLSRQLLQNEADAKSYLRMAIATGQEGVVYKPEEGWFAGHKGFRMMKEVRGVDYDLECIGVEEGAGKYKGLVANLIFRWKEGKTIKCMLGKGWTHNDAENMWEDYLQPGPGAEGPLGKIFQVYALQESSKGKLRLPKVGEMRHDKTAADI